MFKKIKEKLRHYLAGGTRCFGWHQSSGKYWHCHLCPLRKECIDAREGFSKSKTFEGVLFYGRPTRSLKKRWLKWIKYSMMENERRNHFKGVMHLKYCFRTEKQYCQKCSHYKKRWEGNCKKCVYTHIHPFDRRGVILENMFQPAEEKPQEGDCTD
jgi:hypothetical protein